MTTTAAYWADEIAAESAAAGGSHVINDSKTPSGTIHVGSLRGVVLHDAIRRAVADVGVEVEFRYGVEDLDPMDAQSLLTPDAVDRYMGVPLANVPAPAGSAHPNYARHFAGLFLDTFDRLGIRPRVYWMSEQYRSGAMDTYIERALDRADVILEIYRTVSTVTHPSDWLPISVICENCGRSGTTHAHDWDRGEVSYECRTDLVEWARGCGHSGRMSPFGGRAKLVWNVDWAARWGLVGATIEGCGKDLATAGGSRDRADAISRRVFDREPPRNVPYEFLTIGGRKMSTSRCEGAAAHLIAELLPPEILRFLFLRYRPNHAISFDPTGDTIPRLFDEFDRCADAVAGRPTRGELPHDVERIFALSLADDHLDPVTAARRYRPPFAHLAMLIQVPGPPLEERFAAEKGAALDEAELEILHQREAAARAWLDELAPETARIAVRYEQTPALEELSTAERDFLATLADVTAAAAPAGGEAWQSAVFDVARERQLPPGRAFAALYSAFLGRSNGPRAGWLLASLDRQFVDQRLRAAAGHGRGSDDDMSVGMARLRDDVETLRRGAVDKGEDPSLIDRASAVDHARRRLAGDADNLRAQRKEVSAQVGTAIADGALQSYVDSLRDRSIELGERIDQVDRRVSSLEAELGELMLRIPNPPDDDIPRGGPDATLTVRSWGEPLASDADGWLRRPHWELGERLGILDLAAGAKVTGTGFPVYRGAGAALQRALIDYFLGVHTSENGMTEIWPPVLVNADSARGTGQIPDKEEQMYVVTRDDLYLVPTAEVPVTNLHRDEILDDKRLPIHYAAYSPCFRREAGAAGRATRGILRVHQFDKVEMVALVRPGESERALDWLTQCAEALLQRLGLAYRVRLLATGDMGFTQAKTYDLEVWAPGAGEWLEVSSVSNFRDFQARRMNIRYRPSAGAKPEIVHTLNGSALALPRTVAALLEVNQQRDGSVVVPEVLRPLLGRDVISPG